MTYAIPREEMLEQALASSRYEPKDEPAAMEAGVYFGVLGGTGVKAHVDEDLALRVMPSYRGRPNSEARRR